MTYTAGSPLLGSGQATPDQIDAWFRAHGNDPAGLGLAIVAECQAAGVNGDLVAAQIAHETGYWTSQIAHDKNNPAGIGATNDNAYAGAVTFASVQAGVHAMLAHLLTYIEGAANPLKADDPRYSAWVAAGSYTTKILAGLDGHWAWPGKGYGARIAALANELVTFAAQTVSTAVSSVSNQGGNVGRDPHAIWKGSSNYNQGRSDGTTTYFVDHITNHMTAGTNSVPWLMGALGGSSNTGSSATYLVARDGTIYQFVDEADTPWTDGDLLYNYTGISNEHESLEGQGFTDAQITASIGLQARISQRQGWTQVHHPTDAVLPEGGPAGTASLIGHSQVPDPNNAGLGGGIDHHTGCPGPLYPWDKVVAGVNAILSGQAQPAAAPPPSNQRTFDGNPHAIHDGFKVFWEKLEAQGLALLTLGYPQSDETLVDLPEGQRTMQLFERGALIYEGGNAAPWDVHMATLDQVNALHARLAQAS